jgi:immunity protein 27 of polymorphic toxin system
MKLQPDENLLIGKWLTRDGKVQDDATCDRIKWLEAHQLERVMDSPQWGAWETLYRNPDDGRYWERTYPQGELHGGGPPQLKQLTIEEAHQKYGAKLPAR